MILGAWAEIAGRLLRVFSADYGSAQTKTSPCQIACDFFPARDLAFLITLAMLLLQRSLTDSHAQGCTVKPNDHERLTLLRDQTARGNGPGRGSSRER